MKKPISLKCDLTGMRVDKNLQLTFDQPLEIWDENNDKLAFTVEGGKPKGVNGYTPEDAPDEILYIQALIGVELRELYKERLIESYVVTSQEFGWESNFRIEGNQNYLVFISELHYKSWQYCDYLDEGIWRVRKKAFFLTKNPLDNNQVLAVLDCDVEKKKKSKKQ
jgi:hypothetical protein